MKRFLSLILFSLLFIQCAKRNYQYKNQFDPLTPAGFINALIIIPQTIFGGSGSSFSSSSTTSPSNIFGYSDRIIITTQTFSSTNPTVWVSTDGTNFTKSTVKIGDCVGVASTSSSSTSTSCIPTLIGYDNGTYAVFGQKSTFASNTTTISAQYFGTGTDLNTISLSTTSTNGYSPNPSAGFIFSGGKFHAPMSITGSSAVLTTTDGSSWTTATGFGCINMYLADNGNAACGLIRAFNGTSWVAAGTSTGGITSGTSGNYFAVYMDNAFRAWQNISGTMSIFKSTSGSITTGITFPGAADGSISMNGITTGGSPSRLVKTSAGVYLLMQAFNTSSSVTFAGAKSTNGTNWTSFTTLTVPSDLGTLNGFSGYTALGDKFYAVFSLKTATGQDNYLMRSSDGVTWERVTLP